MNPPYIPATALDGAFIDGWSGPADGRRAGRWLGGILVGQASDGRLLWTPARGMVVPDEVHLDPRRPEVAHRIADVLRARGHEVGHLLPVALGGRQGDVIADVLCPHARHVRTAAGAGCADGCGRYADEEPGTIRRTVPAADVSALTLAASVAGVELGRGVVRGVLGEWRKVCDKDADTGETWIRSRLFDPRNEGGGLWCCSKVQPWRAFGWENSCGVDPAQPWTWLRGPETGPEGRAAADAALLRLGYAYLDVAAPFGVRVPFLNLENER